MSASWRLLSRSFFFGGSLQIEREEPFKNFFVAQIGWPSIRGGNGGIELRVRVREPGGTFVVEIG